MLISELIKRLESLLKSQGDINIYRATVDECLYMKRGGIRDAPLIDYKIETTWLTVAHEHGFCRIELPIIPKDFEGMP